MALTDEQKKTYLENPEKCPFCNSENLLWEFVDFIGPNEVKIIVTCEDECGLVFFEYYVLRDIWDE